MDELLEFKIPTHYLSAIINADTSGLSDEDEKELDEFIDVVVDSYGNANFMLGEKSDESYFDTSNDVNNLGGDVSILYLKPTKEYSFGGGVAVGGILGGYLGYKIGRMRPQKQGFETEKKIGRKIKETAKDLRSKKKPQTMAEGGEVDTNMSYSDIYAILEEKIDDAVDEISAYENVSDATGDKVEGKSRSGFYAYTNGGYSKTWYEFISSLHGSGKSLPTKPLDDEMERQVEYNYDLAKEEFIRENEELVEEIGEDKVNYNDLYELGYGSEAEELSQMEMDMGDDSIKMTLEAYYYNPQNSRAENNQHTITLIADVNLEAPYHRRGNMDDYKQITFTFNSLDELDEKMDENIPAMLEWFNGSDYDDSDREMKIRKMSKGGEVNVSDIDYNEISFYGKEKVGGMTYFPTMKYSKDDFFDSNILDFNDVEEIYQGKRSLPLSEIRNRLQELQGKEDGENTFKEILYDFETREGSYAKGGKMKKTPIAIQRRVDEINRLLPLVNESDELAGGYFGSTHYSYVVLTKPIEIKNQFVYIYSDPFHYPFEKRYNMNNKDEFSVNGLSALKYDLGIILKAFKKVLKDSDIPLPPMPKMSATNPNRKFAVGGEVIFTDLSDNRQSRKIWENRKSKNTGQNSFGSFAHRLNDKYIGDYYLYRLDEFDEVIFSNIPLKDGEIVARVETDNMVGGEMPLVKININNGRVYFLSDGDSTPVKFDRKSANVIYLSLDNAIKQYERHKKKINKSKPNPNQTLREYYKKEFGDDYMMQEGGEVAKGGWLIGGKKAFVFADGSKFIVERTKDKQGKDLPILINTTQQDSTISILMDEKSLAQKSLEKAKEKNIDFKTLLIRLKNGGVFKKFYDTDGTYAEGGEVAKPRLKRGDSVYIYGKTWFQRSYGNTYHITKLYVNDKVIDISPIEYGYGEQYVQTGMDMLWKHFKPPYKWNMNMPSWRLRDFGITITTEETEVSRERDLVHTDYAEGGITPKGISFLVNDLRMG